MAEIFFEDLRPGTVSVLGSKTVSADEITAFARNYDAQPFHLGEDSARGTFVGRLIASGWHTIAMEMRVLCDAWLLRSACRGSPGVESVEWLRPVMPGDVLTVRQTILDATPSRSRPQMGTVRFAFEVLNAQDKAVMRQVNPIMFDRRDGTSPGEPREAGRKSGRGETPSFGDLRVRNDGRAQATCPFEEIEVGASDHLGEHTFTAEDIVGFATAFDPQPFHLDPDAAARGPFGRLAASGWQTAALWMRHLVQSRERAMAGAAAAGTAPPRFGPSPGFTNLRWLKPVFVGDTIRYATTTTGKDVMPTRPGWGMVSSHNTGWNQAGELVFEFSGGGFIGMRQGAGA